MKELSQWEYGDNKTPTAKGGATIVNAQLEHRKNFLAEIESNKNFTQAAFAKINIFGPSDTPFSIDDQSKFATQLFYDGWYMITAIEHNFDGSKFTQNLNLTAYQIYGK
jgi:hypothetical protein